MGFQKQVRRKGRKQNSGPELEVRDGLRTVHRVDNPHLAASQVKNDRLSSAARTP